MQGTDVNRMFGDKEPMPPIFARFDGFKREKSPEVIEYARKMDEMIAGFLGEEMVKKQKEEVEMGTASFGWALDRLKSGLKVARKGWNGKGMWLSLQVPDEHSKMSLPYIYMKTADNHQVPWLASQTDMLAEDWEVVE